MRRSLNLDKRPTLKIDWATHEAAKFACENWHYSKCIPKSKLVKIGVWESEKFIGVVIFGVGATSSLVQSYGLQMEQGCELVRIALKNHITPVTRIVSIALKLLKKSNPKLRLVVSFADPEQGHLGSIYQAGGWIYSGNSQSSDEYLYKGKRWQGRSFRNKYKGMEKHPDVTIVKGSSKFRYLMPLDDKIRSQVESLRKPYPKRAPEAEATMRLSSTEKIGGSSPTSALQSKDYNG